MQSRVTTSKYFALVSFGTILTLLTVILGTPFLRVLQRTTRAIYFWMAGIALSVIFVLSKASVFAVLLAGVWCLVGIYGELEKRGRGWRLAGLSSLVLSTLVVALGLSLVFNELGINSWDRYVMYVSEFLQNLPKVDPNIKYDPQNLAQQTPSVIVCLLIMALGNALIFERKVYHWLQLPYDRVASQLKPLEFSLSDATVWIFLLSFLMAMVDVGFPALPIVGWNLVNIGVVLFFFQGLAILEVFFVVMRTSFLFRVLTYIILVGYFFVLLSVVGLIDYWVDFRARLRRVRAAESN